MKTSHLIAILLSCSLMSSCGKDNKPNITKSSIKVVDPIPVTDKEIDEPKPPTDTSSTELDALYNTLALSDINGEALTLRQGDELDSYVKNGLRLLTKNDISSSWGGGSSSGSWSGSSSSSSSGSAWGSSSSSSSSSNSSSSGSSTGNFSGTNVHVSGVDEADIAKYDGKHWYIATNITNTYYTQQADSGFQIVATNPSTVSAEIVGFYKDPTSHLDFGFENEFDQYPSDYYYSATSSSGWISSTSTSSGSSSSSSGWISSSNSSSGSNSGISSSGQFIPTSTTSSSSSTSTSSSGHIAINNLYYNSTNSSSGSNLPAITSPVIEGMYLVTQNQETTNVATLSSIRNGLRLQMIDVQNPQAPSMSWNLSLEGRMIGSRQVDNTLYIVTQRRIQGWDKLTMEYGSDEQRKEIRNKNEEVLKTLLSEGAMSHYTLDDQTRPLNEDCLFQKIPNEHWGYINFVNITSINLEDKTINSTCLGGEIENLSMTSDAAYVTGTYYDYTLNVENTVIHKFTLNNGKPDYKATGSVFGALGFVGDPVSRLSATENDLRIVTSTNNREHSLTILEEQNGVLQEVASLPNKVRPNPIGKPNEEIKSVRFDGNTAYIVTFRTTDPLYSIDLSNRLDPKIKGELVIPGYATYIHPIGDHYLFTLGVDANPQTGIANGTKAELFDISTNTPKLIRTLMLADNTSGRNNEALYNLNALSFLQSTNDQIRIAFPLYANIKYDNWSLGLQMLEVNGIHSANAELTNKGIATAENKELSPGLNNNYPSVGGSRGIIHDDAAFFTHGGAIWSASWGDPQSVAGPILQIPCPTNRSPGVELTLTANNAPVIGNLCDNQVFIGDRSSNYIELLVPQKEGTPDQCVFTGAIDRPGDYYFSIDSKDNVFSELPYVQVTGGYCGVNTVKQRINVQSKASCNAKSQASVIIGLIVKNDTTQTTLCDAKLSTSFFDSNSGEELKANVPFNAIDKASLSAEELTLYPEETQCYFQLPITGESEQFGRFTIEAQGYQTTSTYFGLIQKSDSACEYEDTYFIGEFH